MAGHNEFEEFHQNQNEYFPMYNPTSGRKTGFPGAAALFLTALVASAALLPSLSGVRSASPPDRNLPGAQMSCADSGTSLPFGNQPGEGPAELPAAVTEPEETNAPAEETEPGTETTVPETEAAESASEPTEQPTESIPTPAPVPTPTPTPSPNPAPTPSGHTHRYTTETVRPTCTAYGYTLHTCSCGNYYTDGLTQPLGHDYALVAHRDPAVGTEGYDEYACSRGDDTYRVTIPALSPSVHEHTVAEDRPIPPTCTNAGLTEGSHCADCGAVIIAQTEVPALGHDYQRTASLDPIAGVDGYDEYTCSRCADRYRIPVKALPAPDHEHFPSITYALGESHNSEAYHVLFCHCGELYDVKILPIQDHDYHEVSRTEPTVNSVGIITYECDCYGTKTEVIPWLPSEHIHTPEVTYELLPECTHGGWRTVVCSDCGVTLEDRQLFGNGHIEHIEEYSFSWNLTDEKAEGFVKFVCSVCGNERIRTIGN